MEKQRGRGFLIKWIILFCDLLVINGIFFLVYYWMNASHQFFFLKELRTIMLLLNICYFLSIYFVPIRTHHPILHIDYVLKYAVSTISMHAILFLTCLFFVYKYGFPTKFILIYYAVLYLAFTAWRIIARKIIKSYRKAGYNYKSLIIIGAGKIGEDLFDALKFEYSSGYKILGFFDEDTSLKNKLKNLYLGEISSVEEFVKENQVVEIYCTLPSSESEKITEIMNFCEKNAISFYLIPEYSLFIKKKLFLENIGLVPVLGIRPEPLQYLHNRIIKRGLDVMFSMLVLITIFPLMYIIFGLIIKISSPGPVFFKQLRTGIFGKDFYCYKFRSMKINEEADEKQAEKDDPRITKIGAFLRRTNLDEMPQFINVLKGDMSIVGPRPHMLNHTKLYSSLIDKYMVRHLVCPGITGWAQITGFRGEVNDIAQMEERVKRDVWYIENWSFLFDLKIIALTAISMLKKERENAH